MKTNHDSRYQFDLSHVDMNYLVSISKYHNSCPITKINDQDIKSIEAFNGKTYYMSDLQEIINQFPQDKPFSVECDNRQQNFKFILAALLKKGQLERPYGQRGFMFLLPSGEFSNILPDPAYFKNSDKLNGLSIFDYQGLLFIHGLGIGARLVENLAFDVDDGFYATVEPHVQEELIRELNNLYRQFLANDGLNIFSPKADQSDKKQNNEFYKKEFGGCIFGSSKSNKSTSTEAEQGCKHVSQP